MKSLQICFAGLAVLILLEGCSPGAGQPILPLINPPSPTVIVVTPTLAGVPTSTPLPTTTPFPAPTQRATSTGFPTITPLPSITPIISPTPIVNIQITQVSSGPPKPLQCNLLFTTPKSGEILKPQKDFEGIWHIVNVGTIAWTEKDTYFLFISGAELHNSKYKQDFIPFVVNVKDQINLHVPMKSPQEPGLYTTTWGLRNKDRKQFFCLLALTIRVEE